MWERKGRGWKQPLQTGTTRLLMCPEALPESPTLSPLQYPLLAPPQPGRTPTNANLGIWGVSCTGGRRPWWLGKGAALIPCMTVEVAEEILEQSLSSQCSTVNLTGTIGVKKSAHLKCNKRLETSLKAQHKNHKHGLQKLVGRSEVVV